MCMRKTMNASKELKWLVLTHNNSSPCQHSWKHHPSSFICVNVKEQIWSPLMWLGTLSFELAAPLGCVVVFLWARALAVSIGNRIRTTARASGPSRQQEEQRSRSPWWEASCGSFVFILLIFMCLSPFYTLQKVRVCCMSGHTPCRPGNCERRGVKLQKCVAGFRLSGRSGAHRKWLDTDRTGELFPFLESHGF